MFAAGWDSSKTGGHVATWSRQELFSTTSATLSDIVDDIQDRVGLIPANRDNSALTDAVDGYLISRQTAARRAIEPLQISFFFDAIETGYKIKGVKRGGTSVATIPLSDMGAVEYGSEPIYPLEKTRMQETELPKEVTCQYVSPAREYEIGVQRSLRINTESSERVNIDMPISLSDNKAKQIAEIIHFNYWTERNIYSFSLMPEYGYLDPGDIITVTDGADTHIIRISSIDLTIGGVIQCEGLADRPALYTSVSTGADNSGTVVTITLVGPTQSVYGDWPMLTNFHTSESIYIASTGLLSGWSGAVVYRSSDNGASYSQIATSLVSSTVGYASDILADGTSSLFDRSSTVNIKLKSGTLSSSTDLAILNGANAAMIGAELVQFVTATLESDGTYTLSNLLRGRKGTEWAMGSHSIGDDFVLINTAINRVPTIINAERKYKSVSIGNFLADSYADDVTYTGVNLKPLSPVSTKASRSSNNNVVISWLRRSRFETSALWTPQVGEEAESYEIDIFTDNTYATIARAVTGLATPAYTYTSTDQVADFGSNQAIIYIKIYQISAVIGRGYETSEAI